MQRFLPSALFILVLLIGCEYADEAAPPESPIAGSTTHDRPTYVLGFPNVPGTKAVHGTSPEVMAAHNAMADEAASVSWPVWEAFQNDVPIAEKDAAVRGAFAQDLSPEARWMVEARFSLRMLDELLPVEGEPAPEATRENVAFYTERLVRHENVNADRILAGLTYLRGYWADEQIAESSRIILDKAGDYMESRCEGCRSQIDPSIAARLGERDRAIAGALPELRALTAPGASEEGG